MCGKFIGVWVETQREIWLPLIDELPVAMLASDLAQASDTVSNPRGFLERLVIWRQNR